MTVRRAFASSIGATGAWLAGVVTVMAASPAASAAAGGDPRSAGQGPGLVGDPAFAVVAVIAIGLAAVVLTLAYLRLTAPDRG